MKLNFRQGLISFQQVASVPQFLAPSTIAGYVDLVVSPTPFIATIAHGSSDYLIKFDQTLENAWGPVQAGVDNYFVIEQNVITGETVFSITIHEPVAATSEPSSPVAGRLWFDLTDKVMKTRNNDNTKWVPTPKIVVGFAPGGNLNQLQGYSAGSSILPNTPSSPGYILLDTVLRPIRASSGEVLTTDSPVRVQITAGSAGVLTNPVNDFIAVRAAEPIPALRLVYLSGSDTVSLASSNPALTVPKTPLGIVETALAMNETGVITQASEITSDSWSWAPADHGKPLYCGYNGEITLTRPASVQVFRVGYVKNSNTIIFEVDSETQAQVVSSPGSIISGTPPIEAITALNGLGEVVTTISMPQASPAEDGYMTAAQAQELSDAAGRLTAVEADVITLTTTKSDVGHTHAIADVANLQTTIDTINTEVATKMPKIEGGVIGNFASVGVNGIVLDSGFDSTSFATVSHTHTIASITNLQTTLNGKSDVGHAHVIADVTDLQNQLDLRAFVNHTHSIANVTGLQAALDGKAAAVHVHQLLDVDGLVEALDDRALVLHTHGIADVTGLQLALDGKAAVAHAHAIADVTGLQTALDGKTDVGHAHVIADVTGLQLALDGKANTVHLHEIADVNNLQLSLDSKAASVHVHAISDVTNLQLELDAKAAVSHAHTIAQVSNLQAELDARAPITHTHIIADVSGLQLALDSKAAVSHVQLASSITDFNEAVDDRVSSLLVAGTNVTLSYDDTAGTLTINSTGGGGGASQSVGTGVYSIGDGIILVDSVNTAVTNTLFDAHFIRTESSNASFTNALPVTVIIPQKLNISHINGLAQVVNDIKFPRVLTSSPSEVSNPSTIIFDTSFSTAVSGTFSEKVTVGISPTFSNLSVTNGSLTGTGITTLSIGSGLTLTTLGTTATLTAAASGGSIEVVGTPDSVVSTTRIVFGANLETFDNGGGEVEVSAFPSISPATPVKPGPLVTTVVSTTTLDVGSAAHHNTHFRSTAATQLTVTVQPDSTFTGLDAYYDNNFNPLDPGPMPVGGTMVFGKHGTGNVVFAAGVGVTINYPDTLVLSKLHGKATLIKVGANEYDLDGHLDTV